ncbi:MAG: hypothetical protein V4660_10110 [Pseudomonadota bacterium]
MKTFLLFCMTFWIGMANASLIEINAQNAGSYNQIGLHTTGVPNYIAGNFQYSIGATDYSFIYHNFFVFDLGNINEPITSATLQVQSHEVKGIGTYNLFDVLTPPEMLDMNTADSVDIFNDLGTGTTFGSFNANPGNSFQTLQLTLNQSAINAINSADGLFAIGGSFATNFTTSYIFGASDNIEQMKLILNTTSVEVPQPGGLALLVIGLFSIGFCRKIKT